VNSDGKVGSANGAGAQAGGGAAGQLANGLGHERGAALVPGGHNANSDLGQRVEYAQE
jgi:hypothetical protein